MRRPERDHVWQICNRIPDQTNTHEFGDADVDALGAHSHVHDFPVHACIAQAFVVLEYTIEPRVLRMRLNRESAAAQR